MSNRGIKCVWSSVLVSILTSCVILLSSGCLATDQGVNRNTFIVPVNTDVPSGGHLIEIDSYEVVEEHLVKDIEKISQKLGFAPLPKTAQSEKFELRIWTNLGGLGDPKLLGVRSNGTENNAYFFDMNRHAEQIKLRREHLASPKSGWNRMPFEVKSRLTTPKGLARDPNFDLNRDEPVILLEVLHREEYRRVFYGQNTSFADGKRLIQVCEYLTSEFEVDMNCGGVRTTP